MAPPQLETNTSARLPDLQEVRWEGQRSDWISVFPANAFAPLDSFIVVRSAFSISAVPEMRARANEQLMATWYGMTDGRTPFPSDVLRGGSGPRFGFADGAVPPVYWASSLSHAASTGGVLTALLCQDARTVPEIGPVAIGVDTEAADRFVHTGVAALVVSVAGIEGQALASGAVPLVALTCAKEAMFKSDVKQSGRHLADYSWVSLAPTDDGGWLAIGSARGETKPRFRVLVVPRHGHWMAMALAIGSA